jgi:DNA-binding NarL/FixJ family response regulator
MAQALRSVSVLIVDDHAATRKSLIRLLEDSGMRVIGQAANGQEGVRLCEQLRPQVVVLDISMPMLNGFAAAQRIAKISPATRIVFLTSHNLKEYAAEAKRVGGSGFVCKDHAARDLLAVIEAAANGRSSVLGQSAA